MQDKITEMLYAAGRGQLEHVQRLLQSGVEVNASNHIGTTPLMSACASYRTEMVEFLLDQGADVHRKTVEGHNALHVAVSSTPSLPDKQRDCVSLLIARGIELNATTNTGGTALMKASWFGCSLAVVALIEAGARVDLKDHQGRTAKDLALQKNRSDIVAMITKAGG